MIAAGAAYDIASPTESLSQAAATLLATVLGALVGVLGSYLAGRPGNPTSQEPS